MSVTTTADENLESAKTNINNAINDFKNFIDPDTWGSTDYNTEFIDKIEIVIIKLLKIKRKIN